MATYIHGNVVRKEQVQAPVRAPQQKEVSQQVKKNRSNALHMSKGYVAFLAIAAVMVLAACVCYLQLQSEITSRSKHITSMQHELADMKEANTTKYNAIMNSMNLEEVRDIAMNDLGMVYATADQIVTYKSPTSNAVTQYAGIPESGILASSESVE